MKLNSKQSHHAFYWMKFHVVSQKFKPKLLFSTYQWSRLSLINVKMPQYLVNFNYFFVNFQLVQVRKRDKKTQVQDEWLISTDFNWRNWTKPRAYKISLSSLNLFLLKYKKMFTLRSRYYLYMHSYLHICKTWETTYRQFYFYYIYLQKSFYIIC